MCADTDECMPDTALLKSRFHAFSAKSMPFFFVWEEREEVKEEREGGGEGGKRARVFLCVCFSLITFS